MWCVRVSKISNSNCNSLSIFSLPLQRLLTSVRLHNKGLDIIEVSDDGIGIEQESHPFIALPHATSKIIHFSDIYNSNSLQMNQVTTAHLQSHPPSPSHEAKPSVPEGPTPRSTFGFRGEALHCLANISEKLMVATRTSSDKVATKMEFHTDGTMDRSSVTTIPKKIGTTVAVLKLFYKLPVRYKDFTLHIKEQRTKLIQLIIGYAIFLSPTVRFHIMDINSKNGREKSLFITPYYPPSNQNTITLKDSVSSILGCNILHHLADISIDLSPYVQQAEMIRRHDNHKSDTPNNIISNIAWTMKGLVSTGLKNTGQSASASQASTNAASSNSKPVHYFAINQRPVDLPAVSRLINKVYKNMWRAGSNTSSNATTGPTCTCIMELTLPLHVYDINLSPDKRKVQFWNEELLHNVIERALVEFWTIANNSSNVKNNCADAMSNEGNIDSESGHVPILFSQPQTKEPPSVRRNTSLSCGKASFVTAASQPSVNPSNNDPDDDDSINAFENVDSPSTTARRVRNTRTKDDANLLNSSCHSSMSHDSFTSVTSRSYHRRYAFVHDPQQSIQKQQEYSNDQYIDTKNASFRQPVGESSLSGNTNPTVVVARPSNTMGELKRFHEVQQRFRRSDSNDSTSLLQLSTTSTNDNVNTSKGQNHDRALIPPQKSSSSLERFGYNVTSADTTNMVSTAALQASHTVNQNRSDKATPQNESKRLRTQVESDEQQTVATNNVMTSMKDKQALDSSSTLPTINNELATSEDGTTIWQGVSSEDILMATVQDRITTIQRKRQRCDANTVSSRGNTATMEESSAATPNDLNHSLTKEELQHMKVIGQFNLGFIVAMTPDQKLWILDQHACDERYQFEKLQKQTTKLFEQPLIAPLPMELSFMEETCIVDNIKVLEQNGFRLQYDETKPSRHRFSLLAVPHSGAPDGRNAVQYGKQDVQDICAILLSRHSHSQMEDNEDVNDMYSYNVHGGTGTDGTGLYGNNAVRRYAGSSGLDQRMSQTSLTAMNASQNEWAEPSTGEQIIARLPKTIAMFASRACRNSIMIGKALSTKEMEKVIQHLSGVDTPWMCAHGRPTICHPELDVSGMGQMDDRVASEHIAGPTITCLSQTDVAFDDDNDE